MKEMWDGKHWGSLVKRSSACKSFKVQGSVQGESRESGSNGYADGLESSTHLPLTEVGWYYRISLFY